MAARLSSDERVKIEAWWAAGWSCPQIGRALGRSRVTVWREVRGNSTYNYGTANPSVSTRPRLAPRFRVGRNTVYGLRYDARAAQAKARQKARRPKLAKLAPGQPLRALVLERLGCRFSPQQVAASLRHDFPERPELQVSHETVYRAIYLQSRGSLRQELDRQVALRSGRVARRRRTSAAAAVRSRRPWTAGLNISARPPEAADRAVPGHWEGDLVIGARGSSAVVTLVERSTRYVMVGALPESRVSEHVVDVLRQLMGRLPEHLLRSLTWDNGTEMAAHAAFTLATGCPVYFCDPHSPWQRGSNENTTGLLRQYWPKGQTDFRTLTQADLDGVAVELNGRPRLTLGWQTPAQALQQRLVAATP